MRKTIFAAFLLLSACTSTGTITPESVAAEVKKDCAIIVPIADITALLSTEPATITVAQIAILICNAFKEQQSKPTGTGAGGIIMINGVTIHYTVQ